MAKMIDLQHGEPAVLFNVRRGEPAVLSPAVLSPVVLFKVRKLSTHAPRAPQNDWVAAEAPLEVRIGGMTSTVLMRTPGNDEELVRGLLFGEGVISSADDIVSLGHVQFACEQARGTVIAVELAPARKGKTLERSFYSNASCGVCGKKTIASLEVHGAIFDTSLEIARAVLGTLPDRLREAQTTFAKTGGVHASGLFTADGELVVVREDVGRHNALDKIIGWAVSAGELPLSDYVLLVSGRVSYEIVQKSVAAGIPFIAAVGAPSSLAVDLAEHFNVTLVGFLRPSSMNVYAHGERVIE
jgi:FdhD protein